MKINEYKSLLPTEKDHIIGTDNETGETKNFFFDKIAEYVVGFFQANQQTDFSTPTLYPDMASVMNGANVNLDLVDKKGLWYFNKVLEYKNATLKFDQYINTITVEVNVFTDPDDASRTYIKQNIHNHKTNKSYERMELSTQLINNSFLRIIPLSEIENGTNIAVKEDIKTESYTWFDSVVIRHTGDVNLDNLTQEGKHTFDELGDLTINGYNLNTIFTTDYYKKTIGVLVEHFESHDSTGGIVNIWKQTITNYATAEAKVRVLVFGSGWKALRTIS